MRRGVFFLVGVLIGLSLLNFSFSSETEVDGVHWVEDTDLEEVSAGFIANSEVDYGSKIILWDEARDIRTPVEEGSNELRIEISQ